MSLSDFEIIREMIKETALLNLDNNKKRKNLSFSEPTENYTLTIVELPEDTIVIKADVFHAPKEFFNDKKKECKRADLIVITQVKNKKYILFIEIKGGKTEPEIHIEEQLRGSACLLAYCREIGRLFWGKKDFLEGYEYRFIGIKNTKISIRKRGKLQTPLHDKPETYLRCKGNNHLFHHLIDGVSN